MYHTTTLDDFCFMRQGKILSGLTQDKVHLLQPVSLKEAASGRALILIHGFASSPAVYRLMLNQLTRYDALFCPLLPGHGQSLTDFATVTAADWLAYIEQTFDDIAKNYQSVDVVGLSLGGLLACHLAKIKPVQNLYLLAPALALNYIPFASSFMVRLCRQLGIQLISSRGGDILNNEHGELTFKKLPIACIHEIFQLVDHFKLTSFTNNTIVFLGKYDKVINNHKVQAMIERLPNASTVWLEHSAHILPLDNDLQRIIDTLNLT